MTQQEREAYAVILLSQLDIDKVLRWLEPQFAEEELEKCKITAAGCVKIRAYWEGKK